MSKKKKKKKCFMQTWNVRENLLSHAARHAT